MRSRQHVNPLGLSFETFRGQMPELEPGRPVELEIGCADAQFLFERAALDPEHSYVGLEIRNLYVDAVNRQAAESGLPVQAIFCNANHHLTSLFPPGTVCRAYINFPDPWFKSRHKKRRLIDDALAGAVHEVLEAGGELLIQSDVWEVALDALAVFEAAHDRFDNCAGEWSFYKGGNPYGVRSGRERHCENLGLPIWRLFYRRR